VLGATALVHLERIREASAVLPALLDDARSRDDLHALAIVRTGHTVLLARDDPGVHCVLPRKCSFRSRRTTSRPRTSTTPSRRFRRSCRQETGGMPGGACVRAGLG